jgi:hypothetical protein
VLSILSIGSFGSILSVGAFGSLLAVGAFAAALASGSWAVAGATVLLGPVVIGLGVHVLIGRRHSADRGDRQRLSS